MIIMVEKPQDWLLIMIHNDLMLDHNGLWCDPFQKSYV